MKVAIEARALASAGGGVKTYVQNLIAQLKRQPNLELNVIDGPKELLKIIPWLERELPQKISALKAVVVHYTKAAVPHQRTGPTVVTIYDIIPILFPASQHLAARLYWPQALRHAAAVSDHIITISETSKKDIVEKFQIDPQKITVTPLAPHPLAVGGGPLLSKEEVKNELSPYILFVGTIEPRKNVPTLIYAFAQIAASVPHRLIIAGRAYKGLGEVNAAITKTKMDQRVQLLDFVSPEHLTALYQKADLFVWPSIYEGWGFPPQEAMATGTPVIVSNGGALPEVVGEAGIVVPFQTNNLNARLYDTGFETALAQQILTVLIDKEKQAKMRDLGLQRVKEFTWERVANQTIQVYKDLL